MNQENVDRVAAAIFRADNDILDKALTSLADYYGPDHPSTRQYRMLAVAAINAIDNGKELRTARWKLKNARLELGKAGNKIHQLRADVEYYRAGCAVHPRDHFSALERMRAAEAEAEQLRTRVKELENKDELPRSLTVETFNGRTSTPH